MLRIRETRSDANSSQEQPSASHAGPSGYDPSSESGRQPCQGQDVHDPATGNKLRRTRYVGGWSLLAGYGTIGARKTFRRFDVSSLAVQGLIRVFVMVIIISFTRDELSLSV